MPDRFAPVTAPPYYMAVMTSRFSGDPATLQRASNEVLRLAALHPGFLGAEAAREASGFGIMVTYWASRIAFDEWEESVFNRMKEEFGQSDRFTVFDRRVMRVGLVQTMHEMTKPDYIASPDEAD